MFSVEFTRLLSVATVLAFVLAPVVAFLWHYARDTKYRWGVLALYLTNSFFTRIIWRTKVDRPLPLPPDAGALIICNHVSSIDPFFIQNGVNRVVHWLVAKEYVQHPRLAWAFRMVGSIPVNRSGVDTASTKMAIRAVQNGGLVGLFPEGRIKTDPQALLGPGRQGAALIALKARVPVIPCFIEGAPYDGTEFGCFTMWAQTNVRVGQPIDLSAYYEQEDDRTVLDQITLRFLHEIATLAGHPEFEPKLAGRRWSPRATSEESDAA